MNSSAILCHLDCVNSYNCVNAKVGSCTYTTNYHTLILPKVFALDIDCGCIASEIDVYMSDVAIEFKILIF